MTLTLALNGTTIGSITVAVGSKIATFTTTGGFPVYTAPGDVLTLTTSATADNTFADVVGFIAVH